jgi:hypothetical protein
MHDFLRSSELSRDQAEQACDKSPAEKDQRALESVEARIDAIESVFHVDAKVSDLVFDPVEPLVDFVKPLTDMLELPVDPFEPLIDTQEAVVDLALQRIDSVIA